MRLYRELLTAKRDSGFRGSGTYWLENALGRTSDPMPSPWPTPCPSPVMGPGHPSPHGISKPKGWAEDIHGNGSWRRSLWVGIPTDVGLTWVSKQHIVPQHYTLLPPQPFFSETYFGLMDPSCLGEQCDPSAASCCFLGNALSCAPANGVGEGRESNGVGSEQDP